jgi:hypothetical protein
MGSEPVEIEVPEFDSAASVFRTWAGQGAPVHLVFGPDPILAVDLPADAGTSQMKFISQWRGSPKELRICCRRCGPKASMPSSALKGAEPRCTKTCWTC